MRAPTLLLALGLLGLSASQGAAPATTLPSFSLRREDRTITVQQTVTDQEGGFSIVRGGNCREGFNTSFFYAPQPERVVTTVNNTRIESGVVLREQPDEGGAEAQDKAVLDFFGGSLELDRETVCPRNVRRNPEQQVVITEGRTTVYGGPMRYRNEVGVGEMAGPVSLSRRASGDSPALTADADALSFNVDDDLQTLRGNVRVESEGRVSQADTLELDEEAGFAVLRGKPARSRDEDGTVEGDVIEYDLDSNDVVVRGDGSVKATLELEGVDSPSAAEQSGSADEADQDETGDIDDAANEDDTDGAPPEEESEEFPEDPGTP